MLAIAATYYMLGTNIPQSALDDAVGPRGLPRAYAIVLAVLALVTIVRGALSGAHQADVLASNHEAERGGADVHRPRKRAGWRFIGLALIGIAYLAVVPWLGYLISIALLIGCTAWYQGGSITGEPDKPRATGIFVVAASGAVVLWLLFVALLGIPQPSGVWSEIF
jgi:putative tricarboxylic transport membrane protein